MLKYTLKRLGLSVLILLGVSLIIYALIRSMPTDYVTAKVLETSQYLSEEDVAEIVEKDLIGGEVIDRLLYVDPNTAEKVTKQEDINFYKKQVRVALHGCGSINPEDISESIGAGAFLQAGVTAVTFAVTEGWHYGEEALDAAELAVPATAATALTIGKTEEAWARSFADPA